jgi:hypothetical protein
VFDKIADIGAYPTVVTAVEHIVAFTEGIPTGFAEILTGIATNRAREIEQAHILLLEVTQARRNQANIFGISRKRHRLIV